jgi:hypothetical protein
MLLERDVLRLLPLERRKEHTMSSVQGDVSLLKGPVAQELLLSANPARLAYCWRDGTPRVVPIWFHWNGKDIVLVTPADAPKVKVLGTGAAVAITIDSNVWPYHVLQVRGITRLEIADDMPVEYALAAERYFGAEQGRAWIVQASGLVTKWARISVQPEWVSVLDFVTRFPGALERGMERAAAQS